MQKTIEKFQVLIDKQILFNQGKNVFHSDSLRILQFLNDSVTYE